MLNARPWYSIGLMRHITPKTIRPPFARYSYGVEIPAVIGSWCAPASSGSIRPTACRRRSKSRRGFASATSSGAKDAGLGFADVVRINAFVTGREHLKGYMAARDEFVGDPPPASTLMIVSGFARPEFLVEVEVIAAGR